MKVQHVLNCMFSEWYNTFKPVTIKSLILDVPQEFIDYLLCDGLVLPKSCEEPTADTIITDELDPVDWTTATAPEAKAPSFPNFEDQIKSSIKRLGGKVFPKLNWSSPKDAVWISMDNTLKCTCPRDIYLLLKSSDFITHDLSEPFLHCTDYTTDDAPTVTYQLVLRRWHDVHPGLEFRCFVRNHRLVGITQRHHSCFYPFIGPQKESILSDIQEFFATKICGSFPDSQYVFDVYRKKEGKVYLVDFNPFGPVTDSLLFSWDELDRDMVENTTTAPELRCVESELGVQPGPYRAAGVPQDIVHLTTGQDPYKLIDLLQMKIQQQSDESD